MHPQFQTDVTKPMLIDQIADHEARSLALRGQCGQCDSKQARLKAAFLL